MTSPSSVYCNSDVNYNTFSFHKREKIIDQDISFVYSLLNKCTYVYDGVFWNFLPQWLQMCLYVPSWSARWFLENHTKLKVKVLVLSLKQFLTTLQFYPIQAKQNIQKMQKQNKLDVQNFESPFHKLPCMSYYYILMDWDSIRLWIRQNLRKDDLLAISI